MRQHAPHRPGQRSIAFPGLTVFCLVLAWLLIGARPEAAAVNLTSTTVKLTVDVSGLTGTITDVSVTLTNLSTQWVDDLDILLIHPNGSNNLVFWSDSTTTAVDNLSNATFTIADSASTCLPNASATSIPAGSYKPATYGTTETLSSFNNLSTEHPTLTLTFAGSGCTGTTGTASFASAFGGLSPNGTWEMWVELDVGGATGTLEKWSITVTTSSGTTTAARVESFVVAPAAGVGAQITWRTGFEVDNLGFNVYRDDHGQRTKLNPSPIAGSALLAGPGTALRAGRSYVWWDTSATASADAQYWLEDIDLGGQRTWHGPATVGPSAQTGAPPPSGLERAALLSHLGRAAVDKFPLTMPPPRRAAPSPPSAALSARQQHLAGSAALKLAVREEGWYRVTQAELLAAGLDPGVDPRLLHLYVEGREVPIFIAGQADGRLDPGDALEFYGVGLEAPWTDTRVYWLVAQGGPGHRLRTVTPPGGQAAERSFPYAVERRDRSVYFSSLRNGEHENFFGAVVGPEPITESLHVTHLDPEFSGSTLLEVRLQGVTQEAHRVLVSLNGIGVGEIAFQDQQAMMESFAVSTAWLREGANEVELVAVGGERDISLIDTIRLTYGRAYVADDDVLRFSATARQRPTIGGFSSAAIRVLDVTAVDAVREVAGVVQSQESGFAVTLTVPGDGLRTLFAFTPAPARSVPHIAVNQPSRWRRPAHGADLIIISHGDFLQSLEALRAQRQAEGLQVAVVDVEDIYDEFAAGQHTPYAVRDFLRYAAQAWSPAPRFVLLVGDASLDPKNYLGFGGHDLVPTKLIDTQLMETASDDWLADFDEDGLPELAVGRLPVRTPESAERLLAKIVGYDHGGTDGSVLLVADLNDGVDFAAMHAALQELIPPLVPVETIDRGQMDSAAVKNQLLGSLNRGPAVVNYSGHGSVDLWRGDLLAANDVTELNNAERLSVFVTMTCLNGYFHDAALESLAEALLHAEGGGAVAVWAPSGVTGPGGQTPMNQALFRWLFPADSSPGAPLRLGEAIRRAKAASADVDVQRTWILLGDPTTPLPF